MLEKTKSKCLICGRETPITFVEEYNKYSIYECTICEGQFVSPMKAENYDLLYKGRGNSRFTYFYLDRLSLPPDKFCSFYKASACPKVVFKLIKKYKLKGRLLDIGSSLGTFGKLAQDMGFDVFVTDPSEEAIGYARKNYSLYSSCVASVETIPEHWYNNFDVVTALEVIDHLENPVTLLRKALNLLRPGGHFILSTPNNKSIEVRLKRSPPWDYPPHHLSRYSTNTIKYILTNTGFDCVRTFIGPIDRFILGNFIMPGVMSQLAFEKGMGVRVLENPIEPKGLIMGSFLVKHPFLLRFLQTTGDILSFFINLSLPNQGASIIAVAKKPLSTDVKTIQPIPS